MDRSAATIILLTAAVAVVTAPLLPSSTPSLDREGYAKVDDVKAAGNLLAFKSGCFLLKMVVSEEQSEAINRGIRGDPTSRPMTHELLISSLEASMAEVEGVKIYGLSNGSYRAYLVLDTPRGLEKVDSRPSDATAVAVRAGAPILVDENLLRKEGENVCGSGQGETI
ncbi:MAG: bifunctional nuclease family protein [Candidatus Nanohaloarchaea archaeon]|nr:bifunctional nuclease family protein [Candidatus Nanohaloarchaea archaeon]